MILSVSDRSLETCSTQMPLNAYMVAIATSETLQPHGRLKANLLGPPFGHPA